MGARAVTEHGLEMLLKRDSLLWRQLDSSPEQTHFPSATAPGTPLQPPLLAVAAPLQPQTSASGFHVHLLYDKAALAAPQSFRDGIQGAVDILEATFSDNITVNLHIHYRGTGGGASAGPDNGVFASYTTVRSDLISHAAAGDHTFDALPNTPTIQGQSQMVVWNAEAKLLGLMAANDTTTDDGTANFSTDINPNLLVGVALHELTHAMGRVPSLQPDIFDLFRFVSPGVYLFDENVPAASSSYFSIDGGHTRLADYGVNSDPSDFLNSGVQGPNDPFNEFYSGGTQQHLTTVDLQQMVALGWHIATGPVASPDLTVSFTLSGETVNYRISNIGDADAPASGVDMYLSKDSTITTSDTSPADGGVPALAAGASLDGDLPLPTFMPPGTYYLGLMVDADASIPESDEDNNLAETGPLILGDFHSNSIKAHRATMRSWHLEGTTRSGPMPATTV